MDLRSLDFHFFRKRKKRNTEKSSSRNNQHVLINKLEIMDTLLGTRCVQHTLSRKNGLRKFHLYILHFYIETSYCMISFQYSQSALKTKSWSRLVKVSRTWSRGQICHKWPGDQLPIVPAISHLTSLLMVSVNQSCDSWRPIFFHFSRPIATNFQNPIL